MPELQGGLKGWKIAWLGREKITFDEVLDLTYDLRNVSGRWTVVDRADIRSADVERVRLDATARRVVVVARPSASSGPESGRSLCRYGLSARSETDRQVVGYNHCTTKFSFCASTLGDPLIAKVCYVELDRGAVIQALNEAGVGERYRQDQVAATERAAAARAEAQRLQADRRAAASARTYRASVDGLIEIRMVLRVDEFERRQGAPGLHVSMVVVNRSSAPRFVDAMPITALNLTNGSMFGLAHEQRGEPGWSRDCAVASEGILVNPGQRCAFSRQFTLPGVGRAEDLSHGRPLAPHSAVIFGATVPLAPEQ